MQQQPAAPVRIAPVIIGIVLTIILLAGLAYISKLRRSALTQAPALVITAPLDGQPVDSPLVVRFTSAQPITLRTAGWGVAHYHLHAHINSVEHMPAAADIELLDGQYHWTLAAAPRGALTIRLGWADLQHRAVISGASDTVRTLLR
jgi:hypothetical protein